MKSPRIATLIIVLVVISTQVVGIRPALASGGTIYLYSPNSLQRLPYCSVAGGAVLEFFNVKVVGTAYLSDFVSVPGNGTIPGTQNYTDTNYSGAWSYSSTSGYTVPANTPITVYTLAYTDNTYAKPFWIAQETVNCSTGTILSIYNGPYPIPHSGASGFVCPMFFDGRLNDCDSGETAAVYCLDDGSVKVLAIYKSTGYDALIATPDEIAKVSKKPAQNTLIKEGNGARLYRLTSGELQLNRAEDVTGKDYVFRFKDCTKKENH